MKPNAFSALALATIIMVSIFSPAVMASTIYGPVQFEREDGKPFRVNDSFSLEDVHGNYTLCIRNGDVSINASSSSLIFLNGELMVEPKDFNHNVGLIQRSISLKPESSQNLEVEMRSVPGSQIKLWIEDESPFITINSLYDDKVSYGTVDVSGFVDTIITCDISLTCNGITSVLPLENGSFSTELDLTGPSNITVSGSDLVGRIHSATVLLDGDMLPESYEYQLGFDPLDPDSDSTLTPENEAGNGISDGMEMLGGQLPSFVKSRIGAEPFTEDTDSDGLSDYFELMKLGLLTDVNSGDSDGNGVPDAQEDPDSDGLSNLEEQTYGTDPLRADSDEDTLSDGFEIYSSGTDPLLMDTDGDGLSDDSELRLGTDPLNPDSDGDGIPDGAESYVSTMNDDTLGVMVEIEGTGDLAKEVIIYEETSELFTNISALVSPVVDFSLENRTFENALVTLPYDHSKVLDPTNVSLFYFNESAGTFEPIESTVDPANHTVTGITSHFSTFAIFYVPTWNALFEAEMNLGRGEGSGVDVVYVDVMFTMDSSGSMSWNDPYGYRKIAAKNFVGALLPGDRAGVVDFDSSSRLIRPLTGDFDAVNSSINSLDASGGTNIGSGMSTANNHLINSGDSEHVWMVILLTDGQGSYSDYYTQQAINNDITVYTIGLGSGVNSALLTSIATSTGGQYFPVSSAEDLPDVFRTISEEIEPTDTDGDGIPDITETSGFRDGLGYWCFTDPMDPDTDGDGLLDGEEAVLAEFDGVKYFRFFSDPTKIDSDGDCLWDSAEKQFITNPLRPDTDKDYINDFDDEYPLSRLSIEPKSSDLEIGRVVILGAVFGECGIEGGSLDWLVDDEISSSPFYLVGWIGFSLVPVLGAVADARDAVQAFLNGDELGAAMNAVGAFSGLGDAVKVGGAVGLFVGKYPEKADDVAKVLGKYAFPHAPDIVKVKVLDVIFDGAATRLIGKYETTVIDLLKVVEKNGDLGKTISVMKNKGGKVVWLEEGLTEAEAVALKRKSSGWKHIFEDHIKSYDNIDGNDFAKKFDPAGSNYRNEESIQNLIREGVAKGTINPSTGIYYYDVVPDCDRVLKIVVGSNGYIVTAYPFEKVKIPVSL